MLYVFEYNILFNENIITIQKILHSLNNNNKNVTQEIADIICEMSNIKNIIKQTPETYCDNINKLISK